jgi:hypothetical protein
MFDAFSFQPRTLAALLGVALTGIGLSGCSAVGLYDDGPAAGGVFNPGEYSSLTARSSRQSRGDAPIAALPTAAGRVVDVREKRFGNGLRQEIALAADSAVRGENLILVSYRDGPHSPKGQPEIELPKDFETEIAAEIEARFSGQSLRIEDVVLRNAYGPYGLASGRLGSANCVYLWQSIGDLKQYIRTARVSPYHIETTVRVRLCRGGVSVAQLAQWASNYVVDPYGVTAPGGATVAGAPLNRGDSLVDALDQRPAGPIGQRFVGYAAPPAATTGEPQAAPVTRYAAAPRRHRAVRYVAVRRRAPAREVAAETPAAAPQTFAAPASGYAQPGQVVWTQPGAAAFARSAAPSAAGAATGGAVALPAQAFGGPSTQTVVTPR